MDQLKLITLICGHRQLWDRGHEKFRDQDIKTNTWNKIGYELNTSGAACKEAYKALREKYIREREKMVQFGNKYSKWELLDHLRFLDPHIVPRRTSDDIVIIKNDVTPDLKNFNLPYFESNCNVQKSDKNPEEFYQNLIKLVHKSRPIWDRQYKDYHNKNLKDQLWKTVAHSLKTDVNICMLRWKALREKYIRQKQKYNDGETKWIFLEDMSFLDNVIQYRRKQWQIDSLNTPYNQTLVHTSDSETGEDQVSHPTSSTAQHNEFSYPPTSSIELNPEMQLLKPNTPDSTLDLSKQEHKRHCCDNTEVLNSKREKLDAQITKSSEQIFGDLVASLLATKTDSQKNRAMVEIMQVLTKTN